LRAKRGDVANTHPVAVRRHSAIIALTHSDFTTGTRTRGESAARGETGDAARLEWHPCCIFPSP
jgi:hypothetical protein